MNRANQNQQSLSFPVGPCGHCCNGQEPHDLYTDSFSSCIGGHRDQEVGCKNREKQQKNKWAATLVVKKQNGGRVSIHWCRAGKRQEMSGKCSCLHRQCPVYCSSGEEVSPLWAGAAASIWCWDCGFSWVSLWTAKRSSSLLKILFQDKMIFFCQQGCTQSPRLVIHRACVLFGHSWGNKVVLSSVCIFYIRILLC